MSRSTPKRKTKELKEVPVRMKSEDEALQFEVDLLDEMKKHIDPGPYSWDDMYISLESYPSRHPYLAVDRTTMPDTRPCMGSLTLTAYRPDEKQAHFSIAGFWDLKEIHHNPEFWWKDFRGEFDSDKNIKGHRKFDITKNIEIEAEFIDHVIRMTFLGKKTEKATLKKDRTP